MRFGKRPRLEQQSRPLITPEFEDILNKIAQLLKKHKTNFKIIITPAYNQIRINEADLALIEKIFLKENVFNFSGKNIFTEDKYNFSDINHFDEIVGWKMLDEIYRK
jgi:transposase